MAREIDRERLILRPSMRKWWWVVLLCIAFTAVGVFMIAEGNWRGWLVSGIFAVGLALAGLFVLPGNAYLELRPDGFTVCTFRRRQSYRWDAVSAFDITTIAHNRFVAFDVIAEEDRHKGAGIAVAISGAESSLPDTYGMRAEDLAAQMNEWRERALLTPDRP